MLLSCYENICTKKQLGEWVTLKVFLLWQQNKHCIIVLLIFFLLRQEKSGLLWNTGSFKLTGDAVTGGIVLHLPTEQNNKCTHRTNKKEKTHTGQLNSAVGEEENKLAEYLSESTINVEVSGTQQVKLKACRVSGGGKRLQISIDSHNLRVYSNILSMCGIANN